MKSWRIPTGTLAQYGGQALINYSAIENTILFSTVVQSCILFFQKCLVPDSLSSIIMEPHAPCINVPLVRKYWPNDDFKSKCLKNVQRRICYTVFRKGQRHEIYISRVLVLKVHSQISEFQPLYNFVLFHRLSTPVKEHLLALSLDN